MKEELISAETSNTASHDPWGVMLPVVFSDQLLKIPDVFVGLFSFAPLCFVTLCQNKSQWYLTCRGGRRAGKPLSNRNDLAGKLVIERI